MQKCRKMPDFPIDIRDFATFFAQAQIKRHTADYDPHEQFYKSDVIDMINTSEEIIARFDAAPLKDRRTFAVHVLFKSRSE